MDEVIENVSLLTLNKSTTNIDENTELSQLLPWKDVRSFLVDNLSQTSCDILLPILDARIEEVTPYFAENPLARDCLNFFVNKPKVRLSSSAVPFSENKSLEIIDFKVISKGSDDKVYDADEQLRIKLPRGLTLIRDENNSRVDWGISALPKFTGALGDDDDRFEDTEAWHKYFLTENNTDSIVSLEKANGESLHFATVWFMNTFLFLTGSKNNHVAIRSKNDIESYTEERFLVARQFAYHMCTFLDEMNNKLRNVFLSFMAHTRYTAVFEILSPDHQHVVNLAELKRPLLTFIMFTAPRSEKSSLLPLPPVQAIEIASIFCLNPVSYRTFPVCKLKDELIRISYDYRREGSVLYFLDSNLNVVGMLKKKTIWYIIIRAIREKVRSGYSSRNCKNASEICKLMRKRLKEIRSWLDLSEEEYQFWLCLAESFIKWCEKALESSKINRNELRNVFPVVWSKFLDDCSESDRMPSQSNKIAFDLTE